MCSRLSLQHLSALLLTAGIFAVLTACAPGFSPYPAGPPSEPRLVDQQRFLSSDGTELPMRAWLPSATPDGVIVAVHGFNDYSAFISDAAGFFNDHHLAVYAYDQRGFGATNSRGRWSGTRAMTGDLELFIQLVARTHPGLPLYILGDSMGGAVTIVAMTGDNPPQADGVILVAPAVWARSEMPFYQRWLLWIAARTLPWKKVSGSPLNITPSDNREMLQALGRDPLVIKESRIDTLYGLSNLMDTAYQNAELLQGKTLVLYGAKDEIIPRVPVERVYDRLPGKEKPGGPQLIVYDNGYHMLLRDLQADQVLNDIVQWIREQSTTPTVREFPQE